MEDYQFPDDYKSALADAIAEAMESYSKFATERVRQTGCMPTIWVLPIETDGKRTGVKVELFFDDVYAVEGK